MREDAEKGINEKRIAVQTQLQVRGLSLKVGEGGHKKPNGKHSAVFAHH